MKPLPAVFILCESLFMCLSRVNSGAINVSTPLVLTNISNIESLEQDLRDEIDPRFSIKSLYAETDLAIIPVFMNAVELMARYAEMEFTGRTGGRDGMVLPEFSEVEIAVIPAAPATSVQVRLIVWGLYITIIDMVNKKMFKENEITVSWNGELAAYIYFTKPLDALPETSNQTHDIESPILENSTSRSETFGTNVAPDNANTGRFDWKPIFKPYGKDLPPRDVFLVVLGVLKSVAENPVTEKVPGAFRVSSPAVDANMQFYLQDRSTPRPRPPYFQYAHVLEAARRTPGWMLQRKRFAEIYCSITINGLTVGQALLDKGQFDPSLHGGKGNSSIA